VKENIHKNLLFYVDIYIYISWREQVEFDDDGVRFVLDQHRYLVGIVSNSLIHSTGKLGAPLDSEPTRLFEPVFVLFLTAACLVEKQQILVV